MYRNYVAKDSRVLAHDVVVAPGGFHAHDGGFWKPVEAFGYNNKIRSVHEGKGFESKRVVEI